MPEPQLDGFFVVHWVAELEILVVDAEETLTELDAAIGDADHGSNLTRGLHASAAILAGRSAESPKSLLTDVGATLPESMGGASGPLYGSIFSGLADALPDTPKISLQDLVSGLRQGLLRVQELGGAVLGDKTMVDAILPAIDTLEEEIAQGRPAADVVAPSAEAAHEGAVATIPLRARKGRASYLGPRSEGHQDPGATSSALLFRALTTVITR